jgi:hypothetical protein
MPRAVFKDGVVYPLDPFPSEWKDGQEVWVDMNQLESSLERKESLETIDRWFEELEAMVAHNDPEDIKKLEEALEENDRIEKDRMRKEMGIP